LANAAPTCPVSDSGSCAGVLTAGTHRAGDFQPRLTYVVPKGWTNYADLTGIFLLQPPGSAPPGNYITTDFISVATSVAAESADCSPQPAAGVGTSVEDIVTWLTRQRRLAVSHPVAVSVGGLRGESIDIRMAKGAKGCLPSGATTPAVPLIVGIGNSSFNHEIDGRVAERDYFLHYAGGTLAIEVIDTTGGSHLHRLADIVKTFHFQA
jgi:hypothetical protein